MKECIGLIEKFPRDQKFLIGDRMQGIASDILETLIEAYYSSGQHKKPLLHQTNIKLEKLRYYLRLCYELGYFQLPKYKAVAEMVNELGQMIGGWIKSLDQKTDGEKTI